MRNHQTATVPWGDDNEQELEVTFNYIPGCAAQTSGPPENCYPAEAAEFDIISATLDGETFEINEEDRKTIDDWLSENWEDDDHGPDPDAAYDEMRDRMLEDD